MNNKVQARPVLKLPQVTALYIGAVLGSGTLILPGVAAEVAGPASLLAWGLMTILVLPMALTMGLLSARYPNAGGVAHFVTRAYNSHLGSLVGWYFLMSVAVGAPVIALTGAGYLSSAFGLGETYRVIIAAGMLLTGLLVNYRGIRLTGQIQIVVVIIIVIVLAATISGSFQKVDTANLQPFLPNGWVSVGSALTIIFWCFLGWEAVSNLSQEFQNPRRDAIKGTIIAVIVVSVIYFLTAWVVVGTHSYGPNLSDVSLVHIIKNTFGVYGTAVTGFAALFICIAPTIAYIGAASRLACSLAENGYAPRFFSRVSVKYRTPTGGLAFLAIVFTLVLLAFSTRAISISALIQIPNATFILTYLGGCLAGIILLRDSKLGFLMSLVSLALSAVIFVFAGWSILYPAIITLFWSGYMLISKKDFKIKDLFRSKGKST